MRMFKGIPHNFPFLFSRVVYGRVVAIKEDHESQSILLETDSDELPIVVLHSGVKPVITTPTINLSKVVGLDNGDVLQVFSSGRCVVVYEATSEDNALFFTGSCNSRCIMCPQPPEAKNGNYLDDCLRILKLIDKPPKVMGITGGEPTLFCDDLVRLIEAIRFAFPDCFLHILTNARKLCSVANSKQLVAATGPNAMFCVPLYSDDERIHNELVRSDSFWQSMEGLYNLGNEDVHIEVRNVLLKQNYKRIEEYAQYLYRNIPFSSHIAFMGMEPIGLAYKNLDTLWIEPNAYMDKLEAAVLRLHMQGMCVSVYNQPHCVLSQKIWPFSAPSISDWKVRYYEACEKCFVSEQCGGVFFSARELMAPLINPIRSPL